MENTGAELIGSKDKIIGVICEDQEGLKYGVYLPESLVFSGLITDTHDISFRPTDILRISERMQGNKNVKVMMWAEEL